MITLITGVPGAGKTLYCVDQILRKLQDDNAKALSQGKPVRPIYVDNLPDLLLDHEIAPDPKLWHEWAPDGAVIVMDEAQHHWPAEAAGKTPPKAISELTEHRHRGIDFIILTQHPTLIHAWVRRLVNKHLHIRRTSLGVYVYEWSECVNSPDTAYKRALTKLKWSHPKRSFGLYKSASIHQEFKFRIPKAVYVFGFSVCMVIALVWFVVASMMSDISPAPKVSQRPTQPQAAGSPRSSPVAVPVSQFVLPFDAAEIYLSGVSGQRNGGKFRGVVVFEIRIAGRIAWITNADLAVLGYRVTCPTDNIAQVTDPQGHQKTVGYAPRFDVAADDARERGASRDARDERTGGNTPRA